MFLVWQEKNNFHANSIISFLQTSFNFQETSVTIKKVGKMETWLNWRTWITAIVLALVLSALLFIMTERAFNLSGLDLFFAFTTVVSLVFNFWQMLRDRYKYVPLKNSLIGLFNDLKGRHLRAHQRQILINSKDNLQLDVNAVRMQFYDYVQENLQTLNQLREHVVAAIYTLDPQISDQQVFRAADFGQTQQEREYKEQALKRFHEKAINVVPTANISGSEGRL